MCSHCSQCLLVSTSVAEIKSLSDSLTHSVTRSPIELSWTDKKRSRAPYIMIANLSIKEYVLEQAPWEAALDCVQDALNLELGGG